MKGYSGYMKRVMLWIASRLLQGLVVSIFVILILVPDVHNDLYKAVATYSVITGICFFGNLVALGIDNGFAKKLATASIVAVFTSIVFTPDFGIGIAMFFIGTFWSYLMVVFIIVVFTNFIVRKITGVGDRIPDEEGY